MIERFGFYYVHTCTLTYSGVYQSFNPVCAEFQHFHWKDIEQNQLLEPTLRIGNEKNMKIKPPWKLHPFQYKQPGAVFYLWCSGLVLH